METFKSQDGKTEADEYLVFTALLPETDMAVQTASAPVVNVDSVMGLSDASKLPRNVAMFPCRLVDHQFWREKLPKYEQ